MDAAARLRRTVRRCTAVLVAALGVATWAIAGVDTARFGVVLTLGALLYPAGSHIFVPERAADGGSGTPSA